ncbi:MAG TPA: deoxyribonuclease IV [Candidatus Saccharimonadia bacterium]|nr:deoxyribonuclease IV [Candidatus Saccharimonadia bacterium]
MAESNTRLLGAHLSVAKGYVHVVEETLEKGGNCLQIFSGSPRSWGRKSLDLVDPKAFLAFRKEKHFGPVFIHALYLINLVGDREELVKNSVNALIYDLKYDAKIEGSGVVVHLGSHLGAGYEVVFEKLVAHIKEVLDKTPANSTLLVENSAGQQGKLCSTFEDLKRLFTELAPYAKSGRLGLCIDTCHAFATGYKPSELSAKLKEFGLMDKVRMIHLNDSRDPFASGRDRHENVGQGMIGKDELKKFLHDPAFEKIPLILEVPGYDKLGPDAKNIAVVKELLQ